MRTSGKYEYIRATELLHIGWLSERGNKEKVLYLHFLIEAIKRDIASETIQNFFLDNEPNSDLLLFPEMHSKTRDGEGFILSDKCTVDMAKTTVLSQIYDHKKLSGAVTDITENGFREDDNISGVYIRELDLAIITNGFHHSFVGNTLKTGTFTANLFDFKDMLKKYRSDGDYWIDISTGERKCRVQDFRIPIICEFYRTIQEMQK